MSGIGEGSTSDSMLFMLYDITSSFSFRCSNSNSILSILLSVSLCLSKISVIRLSNLSSVKNNKAKPQPPTPIIISLAYSPMRPMAINIGVTHFSSEQRSLFTTGDAAPAVVARFIGRWKLCSTAMNRRTTGL